MYCVYVGWMLKSDSLQTTAIRYLYFDKRAKNAGKPFFLNFQKESYMYSAKRHFLGETLR